MKSCWPRARSEGLGDLGFRGGGVEGFRGL